MWYFILVPMFLFLVSCLFSIAAVLGLNLVVVTNMLLVVVGIFVGCMIFLPAFKRQWQVTGDTQKDSIEPQEQKAAARTIAHQVDEPQAANEQSSVAASQTCRAADRDIQTSSGKNPPPLAAPGRYHSPG